jgi:hypothetical protein
VLLLLLPPLVPSLLQLRPLLSCFISTLPLSLPLLLLLLLPVAVLLLLLVVLKGEHLVVPGPLSTAVAICTLVFTF